MSGIASQIAGVAKPGLGMAQTMIKGVPADRFARFTKGEGSLVNANHPAFVFGHLAIYPTMMASMLGLDPAGVAVPDDWEGLFKHGVDCLDDPESSIYPAMDEVVQRFTQTHDSIMEVLAGVSDEVLLSEIPEGTPMHGFMPTVGAATSFMLTSHVMFHLGQVSTWRRCEGLGPAM